MNRNTSYTLVPINRILKIFLLTNVKCKTCSVDPYHSIFKSVTLILVLGIINIIFLIYKLDTYNSSNRHFQFHNSIQTIYWLGFCEYIVDLFYMYKTRLSFLKYLEFYKTIDRVIQVPDFSVIRATLSYILICFVLAAVFLSIFDFCSWHMAYGWKSSILYSVSYFYTIINYMTVLDAVSQIIQIEYRLRVIVSTLEKYQFVCNLNDVVISVWIRPALSRDISFDNVRKVHYLKKLYLLLTDQVTYINEAFGVRLLVCLLCQLILLIHLTNVIIRNLIGIDVTLYPSYHLPVISNILWLTLSGMVQLILVYRCEQSYKQCHKAINIIDHIFITNKNINGELKSALTELRELIRSRFIKFHAAGFFTFNYPLLVSTTSVIATYTIIMFQSMQ